MPPCVRRTANGYEPIVIEASGDEAVEVSPTVKDREAFRIGLMHHLVDGLEEALPVGLREVVAVRAVGGTVGLAARVRGASRAKRSRPASPPPGACRP